MVPVTGCDSIQAGLNCTPTAFVSSCVNGTAPTLTCPATTGHLGFRPVADGPYPEITCKVCSMMVGTDTDTRMGYYTGSLKFGQNQFDGSVDEAKVMSYKVYFATSHGTKVGSPLQTVAKTGNSGEDSRCCDSEKYSVALAGQVIPATGTHLMVVPVASEGMELLQGPTVQVFDEIEIGCPTFAAMFTVQSSIGVCTTTTTTMTHTTTTTLTETMTTTTKTMTTSTSSTMTSSTSTVTTVTQTMTTTSSTTATTSTSTMTTTTTGTTTGTTVTSTTATATTVTSTTTTTATVTSTTITTTTVTATQTTSTKTTATQTTTMTSTGTATATTVSATHTSTGTMTATQTTTGTMTASTSTESTSTTTTMTATTATVTGTSTTTTPSDCMHCRYARTINPVSAMSPGATTNSVIKNSPCIEGTAPQLFCPRGPDPIARGSYPTIKCRVCDTPTVTPDSDGLAFFYSAVVKFGPNQVSGMVDESSISMYKVYFADMWMLPMGSPLATVNKQSITSPCCNTEAYSVTLTSVAFPDGAMYITVVPVDSNGMEVPMGSTAPISDRMDPTTTTTTTSTISVTGTTVTATSTTEAGAPTQTATTTVTQAPVITTVTGSMTMDVANAAAFVANPDAAVAVAAGISTLTGVEAQYINVSLSLSNSSRRLDGEEMKPQGRSLQASSSVIVDYVISVPSTVMPDASTTVVDAISSSSTAQITNAIQAQVTSSLGSGYGVTVTSAPAPVVTVSTPAPTPAPPVSPTPAPAPNRGVTGAAGRSSPGAAGAVLLALALAASRC